MSRILEGKVVAVTGAGRGVGREIALLCAREGAAIIVNDPGVAQAGDGGDRNVAQDTASDIIAAGGKAHPNFASVADPRGATSIVEDAVQRFGRIDAVVNNAGILRDAIWHKMSYEDWKSVIDVHACIAQYTADEIEVLGYRGMRAAEIQAQVIARGLVRASSVMRLSHTLDWREGSRRAFRASKCLAPKS
jgi:NAD(P)-dependent dehydrogenase (short-subunit alcohol dehydrogenase family)